MHRRGFFGAMVAAVAGLLGAKELGATPAVGAYTIPVEPEQFKLIYCGTGATWQVVRNGAGQFADLKLVERHASHGPTG